MRPYVEFKAAYFDEPVLVTIEDVSAIRYVGPEDSRHVIINVLGGMIIEVEEDYETVKAKLTEAKR